VLGLDLRRNTTETDLVNQSIEKGLPLLLGPFRLGPGAEVFSFRRPIYLGDGTPSAARFWGFAGVVMRRNEVVCMFKVCDEPGKYIYAIRLVTEGREMLPFVGDEKLFKNVADATTVAIHVPGNHFEMAAVPARGWSSDAGRRWLLWLLAIPAGLIGAAAALIVLLRWPAPVVQVWIGVIATLGGIVLLLLQPEIIATLQFLGITKSTIAHPAIITFTIFSVAYMINAALGAFVWPQPTAENDALQRAPAVLRSMISVLLYGTATLWAAAFVFNLDLTAVGFTSGAVGIVLAFATQNIIQDFFSGVMIGIERPYSIGDWIEVQGVGRAHRKDVSGVVTDMTWRSTSIRNHNSDLVSIPNAAISQAILYNRSQPHEWTVIPVRLILPASIPFAEAERRAVSTLRRLALENRAIVAHRDPVVYVEESNADRVTYDIHVPVVLGPTSEMEIKGKILTALHHEFAVPSHAATLDADNDVGIPA
jgi:small-conductance mechanosensitive channel